MRNTFNGKLENYIKINDNKIVPTNTDAIAQTVGNSLIS